MLASLFERGRIKLCDFTKRTIDRRPQRVEMEGQDRYAITIQVDEYWNGIPGRSVILYGLDRGTDCLGDGGYETGRTMVYASESAVKDVIVDGPSRMAGLTCCLKERTIAS